MADTQQGPTVPDHISAAMRSAGLSDKPGGVAADFDQSSSAAKPIGLADYIGEKPAEQIAAIAGPKGEAAMLAAFQGARGVRDAKGTYRQDSNAESKAKMESFSEEALTYLKNVPAEERPKVLDAATKLDAAAGANLQKFLANADAAKAAGKEIQSDDPSFDNFRARVQNVATEKFQERLRHDQLPPVQTVGGSKESLHR